MSPRTTLMNSTTQPLKNLHPTLEDPRTSSQRIDHQQRTHPRLLIQEHKQRRQPSTDFLNPGDLRLPFIRAHHKP